MERNPVNSTSHTAFSETNVTLLLLRAQCLLEVNQATRANGMPVCDKSSGKRQAAADANLSPLTAAHQRCKNRLRVLEQFQSFIEDQQKTLRSLKQALEITRQAKTALRRDVEREGLAPEQGGACWTLMSSPGADASPEGSGPVESAEDPQTPPHYQILVPPVAEVGSVTPFKLETNESASGGTEVGNAVSAVPVGENEEEVEEEEVTPKQQEWHLYRTWQPSEVMLLANVEQPHGDENNPVRHILCLSTIVHKKPLGIWAKDAALRKQGRYCKQCLTPLRKRYLPFPSWKEARFCYYTGMYYCTSCHSGRHAVIPARVLHLWDFNPRPVCNSALDFLELQRTRPVYCVSAIKPELYVHSLLLQTARLLRLQLAALREMGMACPVFRQLFYRSDIAAEAERAGGRQVLSNTSKGSRPRPLTPSNTVVAVALEAIPSASEYYVPRSRRYLIEESEIWSMTDFDDMRRGQLFSLYEGNSVFKPLFSNNSAAMASQLAAYSKGTGAFFGKCNVVT
uniref:Rubicon Homology domain-containing protein n=1 Tax=Trypanosoma vivax (strain Y486) TaxID=1055687 RepID=G0U5X2_TRYVY|nr:conserved hypothetical protein [Trypanosoma vivax Y486]